MAQQFSSHGDMSFYYSVEAVVFFSDNEDPQSKELHRYDVNLKYEFLTGFNEGPWVAGDFLSLYFQSFGVPEKL